MCHRRKSVEERLSQPQYNSPDTASLLLLRLVQFGGESDAVALDDVEHGAAAVAGGHQRVGPHPADAAVRKLVRAQRDHSERGGGLGGWHTEERREGFGPGQGRRQKFA